VAHALQNLAENIRGSAVEGASMTTVVQLLENKGSEVHRAPHTTSVYQAVKWMVERRVGSLLVTRGEDIAGLFTERDYLREVILKDLPPRQTPVSDVMTTALVRVGPTADLMECMWIMTQHRCRHVLVVQDGSLLGMISSGDILKRLSEEQDKEIRHLKDYVYQPYPG
jgi:CBS domain-containing protein